MCRHYGGENCECVISEVTYNDTAWRIMMVRGGAGYVLPAYLLPSEREPRKGDKAKPLVLMLTEKLVLGWRGQTKQQLDEDGDALPDYVRKLPRAYLVPPRPNNADRTMPEWVEESNKNKRKLNDGRASSSFALPATYTTMAPFPTHPPCLRPPRDLNNGEVVASTYYWEIGSWEHRYESGIITRQGQSSERARHLPLLSGDMSLIDKQG